MAARLGGPPSGRPSIWQRLWSALDSVRDRGDGPLQRCTACGKVRRDVGDLEPDLCNPCSSRTW